jgi:PASTA domain-containing protein
MADRLPAFFLPRVAAIALLVLGATAGLTLAAGSSLPPTATTPAVTVPAPPPLVVPDVRGQAYVFAKGTLEESGFAWRVAGSVQGYAANMVTAQAPPAGTKLVDTGAPTITLTLKRNSGYPQVGEPEVASSYPGSVVQPAATENGVGPALPAATTPETTTPTATTPAKTTPAKTTPAKTTPAATTPSTTTPATTTPDATATGAPAKTKAATPTKGTAPAWPQNRPAAFSAPGTAKEPLDEMPLPTRAKALMKWLEAHPKKTHANVDHWMYQHEWIVTGAKMGWWRGAEALQTLVAVDHRAQQLWGIGAKSAGVAEQALSEVRAKA